MRMIGRGLMVVLMLILVGCSPEKETSDAEEIVKETIETEVPMKLTSPEFEHNGMIPSKFTCDGENVNPTLNIEEAPGGTKSFALIMDDPDVPAAVRPEQMWDHWVVFNIPSDTKQIAENSNPGIAGKGNYPTTKYGGPCPPPQYVPTTHRYFFKLYALDVMLDLAEGASKKEVESAMEGHILEKVELVGKYDRS